MAVAGGGAVLKGQPLTRRRPSRRPKRRWPARKPMSGNAYKVQVAKTAVKRAMLKAAGIEVPAL